MNKINHAIRYAGKLVLTLFLLICLFIPTPAFALDYNSEAKNYLSSVQSDLSSIKTIIQQLPNISFENGQKNLAEIQTRLEGIESDSKQKADLFKNFSKNYQVSYEKNLTNISQLFDLQKEYNKRLSTYLPMNNNSKRAFEYLDWFLKEEEWHTLSQVDYVDLAQSYGYESVNMAFLVMETLQKLDEVKNLIQQYEQESRDLSKVIVITDKVSVLANNLEKRINLAKQKTNNVQEYAAVLKSFSDPDILGEIKDLDQYIGELTQNLPL